MAADGIGLRVVSLCRILTFTCGEDTKKTNLFTKREKYITLEYDPDNNKHVEKTVPDERA